MTLIYDVAGNIVPIYDIHGNLIFGAPPAPLDPPVPPSGPLLNIAGRCSATNLARVPTSTSGTFAATVHTVTVDTIDPVIEWVISTGFTAITTGGAIRAAVSVGLKAPVAITWGGETSARVDAPSGPAITLTSDPIPIQAYAGDTLTVLAWIDPDGSGTVAGDLTSTLDTDPGTGTGAWTPVPALTPTGTGRAWSMRPSRITAPSDRPAWIIVGDSIMQQSWSFGERALDMRGHAAVKTAMGGDGYIYYPSRWAIRMGGHTAHATHVLDEFGINDRVSAGDALGLAVRALRFWRLAQADGIQHIVKTTLTLAVSSTDDWATLDGQTPAEGDATRGAFNRWLRDGAPLTPDGSAPVDAGTVDAIRCTTISPSGTVTTRDEGHPVHAVTDVVAAIESSPDSGKYAIGAPSAAMAGHADGLHPSAGIHALLAERATRDLALLGH